MIAGLALLLSAVVAATAFAAADPPEPLIAGEPIEGQILTASSSDPTLKPDRFRWQRCDPGVSTCDAAADHGDPEWNDIPDASFDRYALVDADVGRFVRVLAKYNSLGSKWAVSDRLGPVQGVEGTPVVTAPIVEGLPPPIAHQTANLDPLAGLILVNLPGPGGYRQLTQPEQIPLGSKVDTGDGHVDVYTARNERNITQVAEFWAGVFKLTQTDADTLLTKLKLLAGPGTRSLDGRAAQRSSRGRSGSRLWGRGRCRCRTGGRHSSGTVRGTWWLTVETPNGTLTKVKQGRVEVRDFELGETVVVGAGEHYLAHAP